MVLTAGARDLYDRAVAAADPPAVVVTTAADDDRAGCLVTFDAPCSIEPPRYAVWLSRANHTAAVAERADGGMDPPPGAAGHEDDAGTARRGWLRMGDVRHVRPGNSP